MLIVLWIAGEFADSLNQAGWLSAGAAAFGLPWLIIKRWPKEDGGPKG